MSKYLSEYQCEYCFASLRPGEVCGCAAAQSDLAEIKARYPTNKIGRLYYDFLRIQKENIQRNDKIAALEKELAGGREEMKEYFSAYYYSLPKTGFAVIDKISEAFCRAGKGCHNTADWCELWSGQTETYSQNLERVVEESGIELAQQVREAEERGARRLAEYLVMETEHPRFSVDDLMTIWKRLK